MGLKDKFLVRKSKCESVQILIPDESYNLVETTDEDGAKALMVINAALQQHKDDIAIKQVFCYYCSVIFDYQEVDDNLWPSSKEFAIMRDYVDRFDRDLKICEEHPNALFVARITHNGTCQMIWMLHDAQIAVNYLNDVISNGNQIREFDYRIESDPNWSYIDWFLQDFPSK